MKNEKEQITKEYAEILARKLAEFEYKNVINSAQSKLEDAIQSAIEKTIPKEVIKVFNKYPFYFITSNDVFLFGIDKECVIYTSTRSYIANKDGLINLNVRENEKIKTFLYDYYYHKHSKSLSVNKYKETILKLKNKKDILNEFPELNSFYKTKK